MYPGQCPRYPAPGLNLPLKHWHTLTLLITGFWLWLASIFSPQDGRTQIHGQTNISAADKHTSGLVLLNDVAVLPELGEDGGDLVHEVAQRVQQEVVHRLQNHLHETAPRHHQATSRPFQGRRANCGHC